jgi:hypothetical protein
MVTPRRAGAKLLSRSEKSGSFVYRDGEGVVPGHAERESQSGAKETMITSEQMRRHRDLVHRQHFGNHIRKPGQY